MLSNTAHEKGATGDEMVGYITDSMDELSNSGR